MYLNAQILDVVSCNIQIDTLTWVKHVLGVCVGQPASADLTLNQSWTVFA